MDNSYALLDKQFLEKLHKETQREIYVKIISLTNDEYPIEEIQGLITDGSINVDGDSAIRRTCSLTFISNDIINDYNWALNTRFKVSVGLKNSINNNYPNTIWFPQGTYIITSFSISRSTNNKTISIQGKDKMCLLNGDVNGTIKETSIQFDSIQEEDGSYTKYTIKDIITDIVLRYAYESPKNIIIKDLEDYGIELLEYRGDNYLYLILDSDNNVIQIDIKGEAIVYYDGKPEGIPIKNLETDDNFVFDDRVKLNYSGNSATKIGFKKSDTNNYNYTIAKLKNGDTAGYRLTNLTYAGDLIAKAGETITSVLDKIVQMLGDFEYFYNIDGQFVFQRKKFYINTSWNNTSSLNGDYKDQFVLPSSQVSDIFYTFDEEKLMTTLNTTPDIANIKNDYTIWGERTSISGASIPIHMRFAIDERPISYTQISISQKDVEEINKLYNIQIEVRTPKNCKTYTSTSYTEEQIPENYEICDWREIIYQMALDYRKYNRLDNFYQKVAEANRFLYPTGRTGYEQYYTDLEGFWRQLYNPETSDENFDEDGWNKNIYENPSILNFWFDFLDTDGDLNKFSVKQIGDRPKVTNDSKVKSIYFKETPRVIYYSDIEDRNKKDGYTYIQLGQGIDNLFSISSQGKSAQEELNSQMYQYSCCAETVPLATFPIYYLESNVLVKLTGKEVNGKYKLSKFTIPFSHAGTMSLNLIKNIDLIV